VHYDRYRRTLVAGGARLVLLTLLALIVGWLIYRAGGPSPLSDFDRLLALALPFLAVLVLALHLTQVENNDSE
jgi:high-affinity Fe2+/Pb2+ permease